MHSSLSLNTEANNGLQRGLVMILPESVSFFPSDVMQHTQSLPLLLSNGVG